MRAIEIWPQGSKMVAMERERETFFLFRLCEQATYIIRAQDTVTALLQVQTIEGVGQLGGLEEL